MKQSLYIQMLFISAVLLCTSAVAADSMWRYTVRPGDNLITLGKKHLINADDWEVLQRVNQVKNPHRLLVGSVLRLPLELVKQRAASAEVVFVSGTAQWQQSVNHWVPLSTGERLGPGAKIATKGNSKVVLRFADGSTTNLVSNSILSLDALSLYSGGAMVDTKLRLQKGQVETHANPEHIQGNKMQVTTPSAIAAVRGTTFRVTADEKATTQETLDGEVALNASNQEVAVSKGFGSKAEQGKEPIPPVVLLPAVNTSTFNAQHGALPVIFNVPALEGAVAWVAKVATDVNFNQVVAEAEFNTNELLFSGLPEGQLYLNLRAKDHNGIVGYEAVHPFKLHIKPLAVPDISQLTINISRNRVFVQTLPPLDGLTYQVSLKNPFNQQMNVWQGSQLNGRFDFPLREYGQQILDIRHVDGKGVKSVPAVYEFDAQPE